MLNRLIGRRHERRVLDQLADDVLAGQSRALVMRGEAGTGKTALLEYLRGRSAGCRVVAVAGAESETHMAFAGLHQLCAPLLGGLERLPEPQRAALSVAFGLQQAAAPDPFMVGLATAGLLSGTAAGRPLVCVIDDAHWLDSASAQALTFAARHIPSARSALVFAARPCGDRLNVAGSEELIVDGLPGDDARLLLDAAVVGPLDARVRDRVVAETQGNPRALLEEARRMAPQALAGGFGFPDTGIPPDPAEQPFTRQFLELPPQTRRLLLVAAAEPTGDSALIWRAAGRLGSTVEAAAPAVAAGLIKKSAGQVRFCHPLARPAVYRAASPAERRSVHRALAEVTGPDTDGARRAWHRAHAVGEPNEDIAAGLEWAAGEARARGGLAALAAFGERAAELTPDPGRRAQRALAAARAKHQAGATAAAMLLVEMAQAGPLDELGRAQAELLRAQLAADPGRDRDAPRLLIKAARSLGELDPGLSRDAYRDAFRAVLCGGRLGVAGAMLEVAEAASAARVAPRPHAADLLLRAATGLVTKGCAGGVPELRRAVTVARDTHDFDGGGYQWLRFACWMSREIWDDESWHVLSARLIQLAREDGALMVLPAALIEGMAGHLLAGELATATSMAEEAERVVRVTGDPTGPYGLLMIAAWRGREADVARLIDSGAGVVEACGEGRWLTATAWASAIVHNGLGQYDKALAAAEKGSEYPDDLGLAHHSTIELIEAAARTGRPERASEALERLSEATTASGSDWALGIQARSQALLSEGDAAERCYRESIERLGRTRIRAELARTHLLYGEWLRRQRRRTDAKEQLRTAWEMLDAIGIDAFAERARRELLATGETTRKQAARKRTTETGNGLTPQEAQVARLALHGLSNPEIGARLFISARTVQYHLSKVFAKLGISSRGQLHRVLSGDPC